MAGNWFYMILFIIYPLIVVVFNYCIKNCIPCKKSRKNFLVENAYGNKLFYLFMPLLMLHLELLLFNEGYPFDEISRWIVITLAFLQSHVFFASVIGIYLFFGTVRRFGQQVRG